MVAADPLKLHTIPFVQELPRLLPVLLMYTPEGAATVTLTAVYVPAATVTLLVIKFVSVCSRVNSKSLDGFDENTETALPLEGVSVIPMIGNEKLTTLAFVGGVSEIVKLSDALPPFGVQSVHGVFKPLHELTAKMAAIAKKKKLFLEFITYPRTGLNQTRPHRPNRCTSPREYCSAARCLQLAGKPGRAQLLTVLPVRTVSPRSDKLKASGACDIVESLSNLAIRQAFWRNAIPNPHPLRQTTNQPQLRPNASMCL
jgi:hypothetical protein